MVHLVYCDNAGKRGEKVLDKILAGTKTMIVRGAAGRKIPHSRVFEGERLSVELFANFYFARKFVVNELYVYVKF